RRISNSPFRPFQHIGSVLDRMPPISHKSLKTPRIRVTSCSYESPRISPTEVLRINTVRQKMKLLTIAVLAIATCTASGGDLKSPDGQYEIEYLKAPPHESNVRLKNAKTGKILGHAFSNGYDHSSYLETAWSHDSRYLAVVERGTRTTADVSVYAFSADSVEEVRLPDYRLNLLGRR